MKEVQGQFQSLLADRELIADLRWSAQSVFEHVEQSREEARRIRALARVAFDKLAAMHPRDFAPMAAAVREIDDTKKTEAALQHNAHRDAWEEADRARTKTWEETLKALSAVNIVKAWVERELEEARNLCAAAESLMESAQIELSTAQAMARELLVDQREAEYLLGIAQDPGSADHEGPGVGAQGVAEARNGRSPHSEDTQEQHYVEQSPERVEASEGLGPEGWHEPASDQRESTNGYHREMWREGVSPVRRPAARPRARNGNENGFGRAQGFLSRSSELIKGLASTGLDRPPHFSDEWGKLVRGPIGRPQDIGPRAPERVDDLAYANGHSGAPGEGAQLTNAEILKDELSSLRRSLESMRSSRESTPMPQQQVSHQPEVPVGSQFVANPPPPEEGAPSIIDWAGLEASMQSSEVSPMSGGAPAEPDDVHPGQQRPDLEPYSPDEPVGPTSIDWAALEAPGAISEPTVAYSTAQQPVSEPQPVDEPARPSIIDWDRLESPVADPGPAAAPLPMPDPEPQVQPTMPSLIDWEGLEAAGAPGDPAHVQQVPQEPAMTPEAGAAQPMASSAVDSPKVEASPMPSNPVAPASPLPATFSGSLHVVFTPCPDADRLGSFWEILDGIAGVGAVVDAHPTDDSSGFEFVLDLGSEVLASEELTRQFPRTEIVALGDNRLSIRWSA